MQFHWRSFNCFNCHLQQSKIVFPKHSESVAESLAQPAHGFAVMMITILLVVCAAYEETVEAVCSELYRNAIGWLYRNVSLSSSDLWKFLWVYAAASLIFQFRRVHDGDFVSTTKDNRDRGVFFAWSVSLQSFYIEEGIGTWLHLGREASMKVMGAFTPVSIDGRFHKSYGSVPSLV